MNGGSLLWLPVLRMYSVASWRKDYNQPEYMCIYKKRKKHSVNFREMNYLVGVGV
jgi:hypothetical protein